ncbi:MAG: hypothetical protein K2I08_04840 [Muribaculaceae bacterium]|nr:hypothetical protein [Muribaculaceae bacterium]
MKANRFFFSFVAALSIFVSMSLSSCTDLEPDESNAPIDLEVLLDLKGLELPSDALTIANPMKVIGYRQECQHYSKVFEDEAYIDSSGHLVFLHNSHNWLNDRLMTFTVYWPVEATITTDDYGRISSGDCIVAGHTVPMNPIIPKSGISNDLLIIRPFNSIK